LGDVITNVLQRYCTGGNLAAVGQEGSLWM